MRILSSEKAKSVICLCPRCLNMFFNTGQFKITRANVGKKNLDVCTYCQTRMGYDYHILSKRKENRK